MPAIHPMAFMHARSLPAEVCLHVALYELGQVSIEGPDGQPMGDADMALLRDACRVMTYECPDCHKHQPIDKWSRDSLGLDYCAECLDEYERELEDE